VNEDILIIEAIDNRTLKPTLVLTRNRNQNRNRNKVKTKTIIIINKSRKESWSEAGYCWCFRRKM